MLWELPAAVCLRFESSTFAGSKVYRCSMVLANRLEYVSDLQSYSQIDHVTSSVDTRRKFQRENLKAGMEKFGS